jgi:DNA polymerase-1
MSRRLVLVDGNAMAYRAFYAVRELSTSDGRHTNAVFGFIRAMGQVRKVTELSHWMVVFDGGIPAERRELLPGYKAQRPPMPDPMREQMPRIQEFLDRAGITWLREDGQEADDIVAILARQAARQDSDVVIVSSDKDFFQLLDDRIMMLRPPDMSRLMDAAGVEKKIGVWPTQVVEWLSLVGDSSDNIPGVPGVGAKTAAKLLGQFGSLSAMWADIESVKSERIRNALQTTREEVDRNIALIRLPSEPERELDWESIAVRMEDPARLLPFYDGLELDSLAKELRGDEQKSLF